jgi:predicted GIY-YIG superfamily endonuclease
MRSNSQQADRVRAYFLAVEKTLFTYRDEIVSGMQQRINELENNQKPLDNSFKNTGVIYVIRSGNTRYKLGRSIDFAKRLRAHNSSEADNLEIVFIYKTNDAVTTEKCAKATLSSKQYRKYKEIYETDIDTIKMVIQGCGDLVQKIPHKRGRRNKQKGNGEMKTYMVFIKDEQS